MFEPVDARVVRVLRGGRARWAQCDDYSKHRVVLYLTVSAVLLSELVSGVFDSRRSDWILICVAFFLALAVIAFLRRRAGVLDVRIHCIYGLLVIPVIGNSTDNLGMLMGCAVAPVVVISSAATILSSLDLTMLSLLGGGALALVLAGRDSSPITVAMATTGLVVLSATPGGILLGYRRRLESAVESARVLSRTDPLTGLLNRHGLAEATHMIVPDAEAGRRLVGVLLLDLDHFKSVNDRFGHLAGDEVLVRVAQAVQRTVRPGDVVARVGGEEICVLMQSDQRLDLPALAERLRAAVEMLDCTPAVTVSVGGAGAIPAPGQNPEQFVMSLMGRADGPLYEVKAAGRNGVRVLA